VGKEILHRLAFPVTSGEYAWSTSAHIAKPHGQGDTRRPLRLVVVVLVVRDICAVR
jgi:hypothetical protein